MSFLCVCGIAILHYESFADLIILMTKPKDQGIWKYQRSNYLDIDR